MAAVCQEGVTMRWMVYQLVTALVVLAFGIVLGRIWEARTTARSKKRITRQDSDRKFQSTDPPAGTLAVSPDGRCKI